MPRFYFDIAEGERLASDDEGDELPGWDEAREYAADLLSDICKIDLAADARHEFAIRVRDETGHVGCTATLSLAVEWLGDRPPISAA